MSTTQTSPDLSIEDLAVRYGEAWNSQDLDAIMALHTPDCVFHLHAPGLEPVVGLEGVRQAFAGFLTQLPDIRFDAVRLRTGSDHWVLESVMSGTVSSAIEVDGRSIQASGRRVAVDFLDVIAMQGGLVARKDSYLDTLAFHSQLEQAS